MVAGLRELELSRRATLALAVAGFAGLAGCVPLHRPDISPAAAPTASPAPPISATPDPGLPPVSGARLRFGLATSTGPRGAEFVAVARALDETPAIATFFRDFTQSPPIREFEAAEQFGCIPMVTWEPWVAGGSVEQPDFTLARLIGGSFDDYLREWGEQLSRWGKPVMLRFAHEMNGNWYPWGESVNGNRPGEFVAAWRHVHDVVTAASRSSNLQWVWSPNESYDGGQPFAELYPGDGFVDVLGIDAYNWGDSESWSQWRSPAEMFAEALAQFRLLAPDKPMLVAETGCAVSGGSRPEWFGQLVRYLKAEPEVTGFVVFEDPADADWQIGGDPASLQALAAALRSRR